MELKKTKWEEKDVQDFEEYLFQISGNNRQREFEKNISKTKYSCLGVSSEIIKNIVKEISKGDILSFLDLWLFNNHTEVLINGELICKIKDFKLFKKLLTKYANAVDNWAACDSLKFNINKKNKKKFYNLSKEFMKSSKPFVRRIGIRILFKFIDDEYIDKVFEEINNFENESDYYVNMCISWLLCETFIKRRDKTIEFFKNGQINKFVMNKAISKCRDSFRVSKQDKEMLLGFRK